MVLDGPFCVHLSSDCASRPPTASAENTNRFVMDALRDLDYPDRLQTMLIKPDREASDGVSSTPEHS